MGVGDRLPVEEREIDAVGDDVDVAMHGEFFFDLGREEGGTRGERGGVAHG
jgi:hypothetical protein